MRQGALRLTTLLLVLLTAMTAVGGTPQVTSLSPANNACGVALNADLVITFNTDIDPTTLTNASVCVNGLHSGRHTGVFDFDTLTNEATVDLQGHFCFGEFVSVTLTTDIEAESGSPMAKSCQWGFATVTLGDAGPYPDEEQDYYLSAETTRGVCAGDFDGDGDLDLATAGLYLPEDIAILPNNGDGTFAAKTDYVHCGMIEEVNCADLNGDGHLDLAGVSWAFDSLVIMLGDGSGTFAAYDCYELGRGPTALAIADYDGDGDLDIATTDHFDDSVSVWFNDGDGTYSNRGFFEAGNEPIGIAVADFDADNDIDIATANVQGDDISVLLNDGNGDFSTHTEFAVNNGPWGIVAADLDGDGDVDLATGDYESSDVCVLKNSGSGDFSSTTTVTLSEMVFVSDLCAADLDGDGDIDLGVIGLGNIKVFTLLNNGNASFVEGNTGGCNGLASDIIAADLDGDGDLDFAVANEADNSVSISLNNSTLAVDDSESSTLPAQFDLYQNYPNPFNPTTTIKFDLLHPGELELEIYNSLGQLVRVYDFAHLSTGVHEVEWNGRDEAGRPVPSGVYFYRLLQEEFSTSKKMILLK